MRELAVAHESRKRFQRAVPRHLGCVVDWVAKGGREREPLLVHLLGHKRSKHRLVARRYCEFAPDLRLIGRCKGATKARLRQARTSRLADLTGLLVGQGPAGLRFSSDPTELPYKERRAVDLGLGEVRATRHDLITGLRSKLVRLPESHAGRNRVTQLRGLAPVRVRAGA